MTLQTCKHVRFSNQFPSSNGKINYHNSEIKGASNLELQKNRFQIQQTTIAFIDKSIPKLNNNLNKLEVDPWINAHTSHHTTCVKISFKTVLK